MKLVGCIHQIEDIKKIAPYCQAVMIDDSFLTVLPQGEYDSKEAIKCAVEHKMIPILRANKMIHPNEVNRVKEKIKEYLELPVLFYITDLGVAHLLKKYQVIEKTIYDPVTMLANSLDVEAYASYGFAALGLSEEITISDVITIYERTKAPIFYQVFGFRLMFHSRRKLISLYGEKINKKIPLKNLSLKEQTRDEVFPTVENVNGTFIYRSKVISLLEKIKDMTLEYAFLERFHIEEEAYIIACKTFYEYCSNQQSLSNAKERLELLNLPYGDGFMYVDSIYNKEEF